MTRVKTGYHVAIEKQFTINLLLINRLDTRANRRTK